MASAELKVDVAYLLNQAKADRNEQVTLTRSAGGSLRVEGLVERLRSFKATRTGFSTEFDPPVTAGGLRACFRLVSDEVSVEHAGRRARRSPN